MDKKDLLPASILSDANVNVYPQYSRLEECVASLKGFCTASTKKLLTQCLSHKIKVRVRTHEIYMQTYHHTASM